MKWVFRFLLVFLTQSMLIAQSYDFGYFRQRGDTCGASAMLFVSQNNGCFGLGPHQLMLSNPRSLPHIFESHGFHVRKARYIQLLNTREPGKEGITKYNGWFVLKTQPLSLNSKFVAKPAKIKKQILGTGTFSNYNLDQIYKTLSGNRFELVRNLSTISSDYHAVAFLGLIAFDDKSLVCFMDFTESRDDVCFMHVEHFGDLFVEGYYLIPERTSSKMMKKSLLVKNDGYWVSFLSKFTTFEGFDSE